MYVVILAPEKKYLVTSFMNPELDTMPQNAIIGLFKDAAYAVSFAACMALIEAGKIEGGTNKEHKKIVDERVVLDGIKAVDVLRYG